MSTSLLNNVPTWLHYIHTLESTNNYAMQLIEDGMAQHGDVVCTLNQTKGKGQRGKKWLGSENENIYCSIIIKPGVASSDFFYLNALVSLAIVNTLQPLYYPWNIRIKWPNDIFLNDKKACGVLIENNFKGNEWNYAIIGIGINVNQEKFDSELTNATSLLYESGQRFELFEIINSIRNEIINASRILQQNPEFKSILKLQYNELLFGKDQKRLFKDKEGNIFEGEILYTDADGSLTIKTNKSNQRFMHGELEWIY